MGKQQPKEKSLRELMTNTKIDSNADRLSDTGNINIQGGLNDAMGMVQSFQLPYLDDLRGESQSTGDQIFNGVVKAVGKTGIRTAQGLANIYYLLGLGKISDPNRSYYESLWNNDVNKLGSALIEGLNEALPNYYTQEALDSPLTSPDITNFIFDKVLDGVSYIAAARLSGGLLASGLNVGRGLMAARSIAPVTSSTNTMAKASQLAKTLEKAGLASRGDFAQKLALTTFASVTESSTEAFDSYNTAKETLIDNYYTKKRAAGDDTPMTEDEMQDIENKASSVGNWNFAANMILTGATNYVQLGQHFATKSYTNTAINSKRLARDAAGNYTKTELSKSAKFFNKWGALAADAGGEGLQESGQMLSNEMLVDYYTSDDNTKDIFDSLTKGLHKTFGTQEGWESFLMGAIIGGGANIAMGGLSKSKQEEQRLDEAVTVLNKLPKEKIDFIKSAVDNLNRSIDIDSQADEALRRGDKFSYLGNKALSLHNIVSKHIETNTFEDYIDDLEKIKNMDDDAFMQHFGVTDASKKAEIADEMIDKSTRLRDSYVKIKANHGHKLNDEEIGRVATVAAISDDAIQRQAEIFNTLKTEYGLDLEALIYDESKGFNVNLDTLTNDTYDSLNTQLRDKQKQVKQLSKAPKTPDIQANIKSINAEIADLGNRLTELQEATRTDVNEANYIEVFNKLTADVRNNLKEKEVRRRKDGILDPTRRKEFDDLIKDFTKLENVKTQFIGLYNTLTSDDAYLKAHAELTSKIEKIRKEKAVNQYFTIKTKVPTEIQKPDGTTELKMVDEAHVLQKGIYRGNISTQSYPDPKTGETLKVVSPDNFYEILDKRVSENPDGSGYPIAEVKVSINGGQAEWKPVKEVMYKNLKPLQTTDSKGNTVTTQNLSPEHVFYNKYRDRLITMEFQDFYTKDEAEAIIARNKANGTKTIGGKVEGGKPKMVTRQGFLGLDSQGNVTFRVWNDVTNQFEKLNGYYISTANAKGEQHTVGFNFKVNQKQAYFAPGTYYAPIRYTKIRSKELSKRYMLSKLADRHISLSQERIAELNDPENERSTSALQSEIQNLNDRLDELQNSIGQNITFEAAVPIRAAITVLSNKRAELQDQLEYHLKSEELLKEQEAVATNIKNDVFDFRADVYDIEYFYLNYDKNTAFEFEPSAVLDAVAANNKDLVDAVNYTNVMEEQHKDLLYTIVRPYMDNAMIETFIDQLGYNASELSEEEINDLLRSNIFQTYDFASANIVNTLPLVEKDMVDINDKLTEGFQKVQEYKAAITDTLTNQTNHDYITNGEQLLNYVKKVSYRNPDTQMLTEVDKTAVDPKDAAKMLKIAAARALNKGLKLLEQYAYFDERLRYNPGTNYTNAFNYHKNNVNRNIETPNPDAIEQADGLIPALNHNGSRPFMKTTNPSNSFGSGIKSSDSDNLKSQFIFNNVVTLMDSDEYLVELRLSMPSNFVKTAEAEGSVYAVIVNKYGEEVKFDLTGKPSATGLIAHAVLPNTTWTTSGGNPRFYDPNDGNPIAINSAGLALNEAHQALLDQYKAEREAIIEKLNKGEKVTYEISNKSLGIRVKSDKPSRLSSIVKYDLNNPHENIIIAHNKVIQIGEQQFPAVVGKAYYVNDKTKQVIPLNSRNLNDSEIDSLMNAFAFYASDANDYNQADFQNNVLSHYLNWGLKPENSDISYEIYFDPKTNGNSIIFNERVTGADGKSTIKAGIIPLSTLIDPASPQSQQLREFLGRRMHQINRGRLIEETTLKRAGKSAKSYVRPTFTSPTTRTFKTIDSYHADVVNNVLTSDMIPNSNSHDAIIKPQWVGGYLTLGSEVTPEAKPAEKKGKGKLSSKPSGNGTAKTIVVEEGAVDIGGGYIIDFYSHEVRHSGKAIAKFDAKNIEKSINDILAQHAADNNLTVHVFDSSVLTESHKQKQNKKSSEGLTPVGDTERSENKSKLKGLKKLKNADSKLKNLPSLEDAESGKATSSTSSTSTSTEKSEAVSALSGPMLNVTPTDGKSTTSVVGKTKFKGKGKFLLANDQISIQPKMSKKDIIDAEKRLTDRYGIAFKRVKGLIEGKAYGKFVRAANNVNEVLISDEAVIGTDYHEEFHIVEDLYLTPQEKARVYQAYRELHKGKVLTDDQVSEGLAEGYRYYALTQNSPKKYKSTIVEKFFKALSEFINQVLGFNSDLASSNEIRDLYLKIYDGNYSNQSTVGKTFKIDEKLQLYNSFTHHLFRLIEEPVEDGGYGSHVFLYLASAEERQRVNNYLVQTYGDEYESNNPQFIMFASVIDTMFENSNNTDNELYNKIVENVEQLQEEFFDHLERTANLEIDEVVENDENSIQRDPLHLRNSAETDHAAKPSRIVKAMLSTLPGDVNNLGLVESIKVDDLVKELHNDLQGVETWEDVTAVLNAKSTTSEYGIQYNLIKRDLEAVNDLISNNSYIPLKSKVAIVNLKNSFLTNFAKMKLDYMTTQIDYNTTTNEYSVKVINQTKEANRKKIKSSFQSDMNLAWSQRTGLWSKWWKDGKEDINGFKEALKNRLQDAKTVYDAMVLLRDLGITFSDPDLYDVNKAKKKLSKYVNISDFLNNVISDNDFGVIPNLLKKVSSGKYNLFSEGFYNTISRVKNLTDLEVSIVGENLNNSVLTPSNKRLYPYSDENTIARKIKDYNNENGTDVKLISVVESAKSITSEAGVITRESKTTGAVEELSEVQLLLSDIATIASDVHPFLFGGSKSMYYGIQNLTSYEVGADPYEHYADIVEREVDFYINQKYSPRVKSTVVTQKDTGFTNLDLVRGIAGDAFTELLTNEIETNESQFNFNYFIQTTAANKLFREGVKGHVNRKVNNLTTFLKSNNVIQIEKGKMLVKALPNNLLNKYKTLLGKSFKANEAYDVDQFNLMMNQVLSDFVINTEYNRYLQLESITGNLAYFKDPLKRFMGYQGTRLNINVGDEFLNLYNDHLINPNSKFNGRFSNTVSMISFNDVMVNNTEMADYFTKLNDLVSASSYASENGAINVTDGQGYEHIDFYRFRRIAEGTWTEEMENVYNKSLTGEALTANDVYLMIGKTQGVSQYEHEGIMNPVFIKTSVIIPSLVKGTELEKMSDWMGENGIGMMMYESAVKFGRLVDPETRSGLSVFDENGKFVTPENHDDFVQNVDLRYYGTQLKMHDAPKSKITTGTQQRSLIFSNITNIASKSEDNKAWANQIIDDIHTLEVQKAKTALARFKERLGIVETEDGYRFESYEVLAEELIKETEMRDMPMSVKNDIQFMLDKYKTLDLIPRESKIESVLLSLVTSNVIKSKRKGDAKAMASSAGFASFDKSDIIKSGFSSNDVKTGVSDIFKDNPELANIGSEAQYSAYLDTIFPDSEVKDIVLHNSPNKFEKFNINRGRLGNGIYFGLDYKIYNTGRYNYNALLNITNLKRYDKGEFVITANKLYPSEDDYSTKPQDTLRATDEASGVNGYVSTSPVGTEFLVFEPEQIHILGSKQDIEGFKNYIDSLPTQNKYDLKFYPITEDNNSFAMEVFLPSYLKDHLNLSQEIKLNDDLDNPLFKLIGFRIPTQGLNSIEVIKVKGFLPAHMGNTIIVPKEITAKAGSDFDIDKLNLYFPNVKTKVVKGNVVSEYVKFLDETNSTLNERYEAYVNDNVKNINSIIKDLKQSSEYQDYVKAVNEAYENELAPIKRRVEENNQLWEDVISNNIIWEEYIEGYIKDDIRNYNKILDDQGIEGLDKQRAFAEYVDILKLNYPSDVVNLNALQAMYNYQLTIAGDTETLNGILNSNQQRFRVLKNVLSTNFRNEMYNVIAEYSGLTDRNSFSALPMEQQNSIKAIENRLLEKHIEILQHPDNRRDILTPNTDYNIKGIAKGQGNAEYPNDRSVRALKKNNKPFAKSDMLDILYSIKQKKAFEAGKNTLAQFALHMVNHVKSQLAGLHLNPKIDTSMRFKSMQNSTGRLDLIYDNKGRLITKNIEQLENAAVDAEKDEYLSDLNISVHTTAPYMYMIRRGLSLEEASLFLSQPIITHYLNELNKVMADPEKALTLGQAKKLVKTSIKREFDASITQPNDKLLFTEESLIGAISNEAPITTYQEAVWQEFLKYEEMGAKLNKLIQITTFDTKASSTSYMGNMIREYDYNKFIDVTNVHTRKDDAQRTIKQPIFLGVENFYSYIAPDNTVKPTYTGYFKDVVFEANKYYDNLYKSNEYLNDPSVKMLVDNILESTDVTEQIKIRNLTNLKREMITYVVQNNISRNGLTINERKRMIATGPDSIPSLINRLKNADNNPLSSNYLIQNLVPVIHNDSAHLLLLEDANDVSVERSNAFTEAFHELYSYLPDLAYNIIEHSILQSGFVNSSTTLHNIIPVELLAEVVGDYYADLQPDFSNFADVYLLNNINNPTIVPNGIYDMDTQSYDGIPYRKMFAKGDYGTINIKTEGGGIRTISRNEDGTINNLKDYSPYSVKHYVPVQSENSLAKQIENVKKQLQIKNCNQ